MKTATEDILKVSQKTYLDHTRARPFIKWAGGKRTLIPVITRMLPDRIATYWEPFLGGGAIFFALDSQLQTAILSDVNAELTLAYQMVKREPGEVIEKLKQHETRHGNKNYYYRVRDMIGLKDAVEVAARFIYLNKTCYNGLYRVNKAGFFNVPRGSYTNPVICDASNIRAASLSLQKSTIKFQDFAQVEPGERDFIYCDPPYDGTFAGYDAGGFGGEEQLRLRDIVLKWHKLGAKVMVSNSDTGLIRELYSGSPFTLTEVSAPRNINTNGSGRGPTPELIITTY